MCLLQCMAFAVGGEFNRDRFLVPVAGVLLKYCTGMLSLYSVHVQTCSLFSLSYHPEASMGNALKGVFGSGIAMVAGGGGYLLAVRVCLQNTLRVGVIAARRLCLYCFVHCCF